MTIQNQTIWTCISYQQNVVTFLMLVFRGKPNLSSVVVGWWWNPATSNLWVSGHNLQIGSEPLPRPTWPGWPWWISEANPRGGLQTQVKLYMELTFWKFEIFWNTWRYYSSCIGFWMISFKIMGCNVFLLRCRSFLKTLVSIGDVYSSRCPFIVVRTFQRLM